MELQANLNTLPSSTIPLNINNLSNLLFECMGISSSGTSIELAIYEMKQSEMKTITLLTLALAALLGSTIKAHAQCSTCHTTISTSQSGSIEVGNNKTLCITSTGSFSGEISLKTNSVLCIEAGAIVDLSNINFSSSCTINNYGTLTIDDNIDMIGTINNHGELSTIGTFVNKGIIANEGTFINTGSFTNSTASKTTFTNSGDFSVIGNFSNQNDFTNEIGATLEVSGTFDNTNAGSGSLINESTIFIGSHFTNSNDFSNTGSVIIEGNFNNTSSGSTTLVNEGNFKVRGDFTNSNDVNNTGTFTIQGDFSQSNTGSAEVINDGEFFFEGDVYSDNDMYNSGAMTIGGTYTNKKWSGIFYAEPNSILVVDSLVNEYTITSTASEYGQIQVVSYSNNSGSVATYVDVCILSNSGNWNANTGSVNANVTNCTTPVSTPQVSLNIKLFLESCYQTSSSNMATSLRGNKVLPKNHPFKASPWNYNGTDKVDDSTADISTNIVDWVLLEFRTSASASSAFYSKTFFLNSAGNLTNANGSPATMSPPTETNFYIVVEARNHLGVMSSSTVSVVGGAITYDFTTAQSKAYSTGTPPMEEVSSGIFALYSGDINGDGTINAKDALLWLENSGQSGYKSADLNLDNDVDASDKSIWLSRNGFSIQYQR